MTHSRARRLSVIAIVAALHAGVVWVLLEAKAPLKIRTAASSEELTYLNLNMPTSKGSRPAPIRRWLPLLPHGAASPPSNLPQAPSTPSAAAQSDEDNAIHPPIDWANELSRTAREAAAASAPQPRVFGAPHIAPTPPAKPPEFGWSYSRTHRVETGPNGTVIHLNDRCAIALAPLPFPVCVLGKREANGDLFKHMRDPPQPGESNDPP